MSEPEPLEALLAERAIRTVLTRYCRGIDRLALDVVRSCYHDDATDEHGSFAGTADEFVAWVAPLLERYDMTMHLLGNVSIELAGGVALAESYGIAVHRTSAAEAFDPVRNLTTGFRFVDRFELRDEWRIARRIAITEWSRVDDLAGRFEPGAGLRRGVRGPEDPVWWLVPEVHPSGAHPGAT